MTAGKYERRYRPRPVAIEAMHWDSPDDGRAIIEWICAEGKHAHEVDDLGEPGICIHADGHCVVAHPGDWVVRREGATLLVYSPAVFENIYEEAAGADH